MAYIYINIFYVIKCILFVLLFILIIAMLRNLYSNRFLLLTLYYFVYVLFIFYVIKCLINIPIGHSAHGYNLS